MKTKTNIKRESLSSVAHNTTKSAKFLSLEDIEKKMVELATDDSNDVLVNMINEKKLNMLEKVANLKIKIMEVNKDKETNDKAEPITVNFVSSDNETQKERLARIDKEISKGVGEDA